MVWPWTRSFSAPSNLGLPLRGLDKQLHEIQVLNGKLEDWYWNVFAPRQLEICQYQLTLDGIIKVEKRRKTK